MDNERFDRWAKHFAKPRNRRGVLSLLAGSAMTLLVPSSGHAQVSSQGQMCGGIAGLPCPDGFTCVDNPADACDPNAGGADCAGVCVPIDENPCAAILCIEGTTCCPFCGGVCIPPGVECSETLCDVEPCAYPCSGENCGGCDGPPAIPGGEPCGTAICGAGEYCCNPSCGICVPLGGSCIELACDPPGQGVPCGPTVCAVGEVCCNESCGICTPPDGVCIAMYCGA